MKRAIDIAVALFGLVVFSPLLLICAVAVKLDSKGPVLFTQERIGRGFRPFTIYKLRTMVAGAPARGRSITAGGDDRITRVGRLLRRTKLDELPQLFNVLVGDMSLVGPRPELGQYVDRFRADYEEILRVRPGMTDIASLEFIDEESVLARADDTERAYTDSVLPRKLLLGKQYVHSRSLAGDLLIVLRTLARIGMRKSAPYSERIGSTRSGSKDLRNPEGTAGGSV